MTTFPNDGGYDELIVARSIPVRSLCEHHMLPFIGTAHIGYLPGAASWACQRWPASWSTSPAARRFRNA